MEAGESCALTFLSSSRRESMSTGSAGLGVPAFLGSNPTRGLRVYIVSRTLTGSSDQHEYGTPKIILNSRTARDTVTGSRCECIRKRQGVSHGGSDTHYGLPGHRLALDVRHEADGQHCQDAISDACNHDKRAIRKTNCRRRRQSYRLNTLSASGTRRLGSKRAHRSRTC